MRQRFAALSTESEIAAVVRQERESLLSEIARHDFATRNAGGDWMHRHAELIDACLRRLLSLAGERGEQPAKTGIAILATGATGNEPSHRIPTLICRFCLPATTIRHRGWCYAICSTW